MKVGTFSLADFFGRPSTLSVKIDRKADGQYTAEWRGKTISLAESRQPALNGAYEGEVSDKDEKIYLVIDEHDSGITVSESYQRSGYSHWSSLIARKP